MRISIGKCATLLNIKITSPYFVTYKDKYTNATLKNFAVHSMDAGATKVL